MSCDESATILSSYQNGQTKQLGSVPLGCNQGKWRHFYDAKKCHHFIYHVFDNNSEIYFLNVATKQFEVLPLEGAKTFLSYDDNGVLWLSNNDGIALVHIEQSPFEYYEGVVNARGLWADTANVIVASSHEADYRFDIQNQQPKVDIGTGIYAIANDKNDLWGGSHGVFNQINPSTNEVLKTIPFKQKYNWNIWAALKDSDENWWFSHEKFNADKYILYYNPTKSDSADLFTQYNDFEALKAAHIMHFLDDKGLVWASSNNGLILIDKQKGVVGNYQKEAKKEFQLPFTDVYWLYKDDENVYWAATNHSGLVKFTLDAQMKVQSFQQYSTDYGISSDVIYAIFEDDFERLWLSTLNGITYFDKKNETVRIYTDLYGDLPMNEFNRTSGFQAIDGRIYFGGITGAIGFYPKNIDITAYDKRLVLSSVQFFTGAEEVKTNETTTILNQQKITLQPSIRYAKIKVALADYFDAKDAQYYYKIVGIHDDFRLMDGNEVLLSSLPYGKYRIIFRGQAADKRFSTHEINLPLIVVRPFYLKWWFILLVLAAITLILWQLYNWRVAQLKKRQVELEKIVAQRTEEIRKDKATIEKDKAIIEQQAEELKALDKLKDRFFANISHELRTPLTLILGPLGSLLKDNNQLTNKQFTYLSVIKRHTNYLMKRINEIMELNRLEVKKGQIDLQPIKLYDSLKVTISNFESIAPQKQITFSFDYKMKKTAQVMMDKDKFEHIIYNYLSNAFKYTPKNGKVKVTVKEVENKLRLEVQDTGVGIPKADIPNLFKRFFQAENAQKAGSSGIGLALCREIAELLNGQVWAESKVGKGSTFFFEVPYEEFIGMIGEELIQKEEEQGLRNLGSFVNLNAKKEKPTILLVEDNAELRDYIQVILSEFYQVETAENGQAALERLTDTSLDTEQTPVSRLTENSQQPFTVHRLPSAIISDIMMPVMDGLELLDFIKKSDDYRHIPMVMLTARQSIDAKLSALQLGVDDYITKPFNEEELLIRIKNILRNQQARLAFLKEEGNIDNEVSDTSKVSDTKSKKIAPIQLTQNDQKWLKEVEALVESHLTDNQFTVAVCAEKLFLSKRQFQRRIKKYTGLNFTSYVRLARLRKARQLLENSDVTTVAAIAQEVGFDTPAYFSKVYYQEFGKKPVDYL